MPSDRKEERCICGNGEAEEDRGAVLRCPVHGPRGLVARDASGFHRRTAEALAVARSAAATARPDLTGEVLRKLLDELQEARDEAEERAVRQEDERGLEHGTTLEAYGNVQGLETAMQHVRASLGEGEGGR